MSKKAERNESLKDESNTKDEFKMLQPRFSRDRILKSASRPREWFNIKTDTDTPEVFIFDQIGQDWWGDGISPKDFINEVKEIEGDAFNLHINSPGGFVHDGLAIYNFLNRLDKHITTYNDGIAASIASIIFMVGDERIMPVNTDLMVHNAWTIVVGNKENLREEANLLESVDKNLANILHDGSGHDFDKIVNLMKKETYINGNDALKMGFATQIEENKKLAACAFDTLFADDAESFNNKAVINKKRNMEEGLSELGYSNSESVAIVNRSESVSIGVKDKEEEKPVTIII